jgi:hypothetical protein
MLCVRVCPMLTFLWGLSFIAYWNRLICIISPLNNRRRHQRRVVSLHFDWGFMHLRRLRKLMIHHRLEVPLIIREVITSTMWSSRIISQAHKSSTHKVLRLALPTWIGLSCFQILFRHVLIIDGTLIRGAPLLFSWITSAQALYAGLRIMPIGGVILIVLFLGEHILSAFHLLFIQIML